MKTKNIYLLIVIFSSFIFAEVYEDAEDGAINRWKVQSGATIVNEYDSNRESRVIKLNSPSYKYYTINTPNRTQSKILKWDMKINKSFYIYIKVTTSKGVRQLYYNAINRDYGKTSGGIHYGLGTSATDNSWHTFERNIEDDIKNIDGDSVLISIDSFKIRSKGIVYIDNIIIGNNEIPTSTPTLTPTPAPTSTPTSTPTPTPTSVVIEDAEDGVTNRWRVQSGATIANGYDSNKESRVIKLNSPSYKYYTINTPNGTQSKILKWDMKINKGFYIYIKVTTSKGVRQLYYNAINRDYGKTSGGIHYGLGSSATDNSWHTFKRNIEEDIKNIDANNELISIDSFKIRSNGIAYIDNIILENRETSTSTSTSTPTSTPLPTFIPVIIPPAPSNHGVNSVFDLPNKILDKNPTFEEPFVGSYGRSTEHIYHAELSHTDDGSGSVELRGHGWRKGLRTKPFHCEAHKKYLLSAYIKIKNLNLGQNLFFTIPGIEGGGIYWNVSKENTWEEILFQFVPKTTTSCELYIMTNNRSFSTTKNSNGTPKKVKSSGSNLDRRAKIFIDDLKIVQTNKIIPRERRSSKKVFNSSYIHVDALGNFSVKEEAGWKSIFPKMIYRNSGNQDRDMIQYRAYAEYGFNGIMDIKRKEQVVHGLDVGLKYFAIVASNDAELEEGEAFPRDTRELIDYVNNDLGKPYTLLFYNHDNENSALQDYNWHRKLTAFINKYDKDLSNPLKRARPIYYLNGHAGVARAYNNNNNNRVQMDIAGSYVADKVEPQRYIPRPHETLGILDKGQNQIAPVTMIQLQSYLNEKLIPSLFYGIIQGGKGVSIWRDGGTQVKFQNAPWASHIKSVFTKIDKMLPIIREAHWTNWSADVTDKGAMVNIGTRNHNGKGYLILSSHSNNDEHITISLKGISASSVEDYFTHKKVANIVSGKFSMTIGHNHNGYLVLKLN